MIAAGWMDRLLELAIRPFTLAWELGQRAAIVRSPATAGARRQDERRGASGADILKLERRRTRRLAHSHGHEAPGAPRRLTDSRSHRHHSTAR